MTLLPPLWTWSLWELSGETTAAAVSVEAAQETRAGALRLEEGEDSRRVSPRALRLQAWRCSEVSGHGQRERAAVCRVPTASAQMAVAPADTPGSLWMQKTSSSHLLPASPAALGPPDSSDPSTPSLHLAPVLGAPGVRQSAVERLLLSWGPS